MGLQDHIYLIYDMSVRIIMNTILVGLLGPESSLYFISLELFKVYITPAIPGWHFC